MQRTLRIGLGLALAAGVAAGCGDEAPTAVGSELLGEGLRTVRVVLDAAEFLQGDTTYDGIGDLNDVGYGIVARDFEGDLNANFLFRVIRPFQVSYEGPTGASQTDSLAAIRGGTLTVVIDSLSEATAPIDLEVVTLAEDWDRNTASWDLRVDTAGVAEPWTVPGGTPGSVLSTGTWEGGDTVRISVDSATASVWHDTTAAQRGGLLRVASPGGRLRVQSVDFTFDVVPVTTDTVLTAGQAGQAVTVASPDTIPPSNVLRVGGLPVWRSLVHFQPLADLPVPCDIGPTTCTIALSEVTVNTANLLLRTQPVGGRRIERDMRLEGRALLVGPGVPLTRSPMSSPLGRMTDGVDVAAFTAAGAPFEARVPITGYIRQNLTPPDGEDPLLWLGLTAEGERLLFGYGEFGSFTSAAPPRLELVVTIPVRKVEP